MDSNTAGKYPSDGNPTLSYLSDLIAAHPLNEKILVVPSFHIGHQIGEALAASGCSWINLRTATLSSLALDTAGAELAASGVTRIPGMASRLILNRILRDLKAAGLLPFFGRLEIRSGIVNAIHRSLRELRLTGISGSELKPELFKDPQKGRELSLILTRYEEAERPRAEPHSHALRRSAGRRQPSRFRGTLHRSHKPPKKASIPPN